MAIPRRTCRACWRTVRSATRAAARRRFQRLAGGADRVALADFQALPELAGHPLAPRILALADKDRDGYLRLADFTAAVGELGRLRTDDDRAACARPPAAGARGPRPGRRCPCGALQRGDPARLRREPLPGRYTT